MLGRQGEEETGDDREKEVEEGWFCMNTGVLGLQRILMLRPEMRAPFTQVEVWGQLF